MVDIGTLLSILLGLLRVPHLLLCWLFFVPIECLNEVYKGTSSNFTDTQSKNFVCKRALSVLNLQYSLVIFEDYTLVVVWNFYISTFTSNIFHLLVISYPSKNCLLKVNNKNTRKWCEILSMLTIKTPNRRQWCRPSVLIVNFEHILHLSLAFLLLTLNKQMFAGWSYPNFHVASIRPFSIYFFPRFLYNWVANIPSFCDYGLLYWHTQSCSIKPWAIHLY